MGTVLLVDGHAYAYRAFHAIHGLKSADGRPTGAIFGFLKMLARLRGVVNPTHLAVVWDGGLDSDRADLLPEYKAQRPAMPDALDDQIGEIMGYLPEAGISSIQQDGAEADDLIATLAALAEPAGMRVVIASSDKDFFQLVSADVGLLNPADKSEAVWGEARVVEKTGVRPEQVVDWLSLIGDSVDNIAGVPGVGPKTATDLLLRFGSVDGLYARLDELEKPRIRASLQLSQDVVRRNQKMIRLKRDVAGVPPLTELVQKATDQVALLDLYRKWGFRGMAAEAEAALRGQDELFKA